jgi:hypothetical protein
MYSCFESAPPHYFKKCHIKRKEEEEEKIERERGAIDL